MKNKVRWIKKELMLPLECRLFQPLARYFPLGTSMSIDDSEISIVELQHW